MLESSTDDEALPGVAASGETQSGDTGSGSSSSTQADTSADSAPAGTQDDNKPSNIADAVRAALSKGKEQSSGSGESEEDILDPAAPIDAKAKEGEDEDLGDLTDEELNSYKGKTQRRFKQLDGKNKALLVELEQTKPLIELGSSIKRMADKANLTKEDINTGFNIMDLMRNNPKEAYTALKPIYEALCGIVGVILPPDLQQQVAEGKITEPAAKELSMLRNSTGLSAAQQKEQKDREARVAQEAVTQQFETLKVDVGKAATEWENRWKASDPDYAHKQSRVLEGVELEIYKRAQAGTLPTTVKDAIAMCNTVKAKVESEMKKLLPKKTTPINHITGNGAMNGSKPVPTSSKDAIMQSLGH